MELYCLKKVDILKNYSSHLNVSCDNSIPDHSTESNARTAASTKANVALQKLHREYAVHIKCNFLALKYYKSLHRP